MIPDLTRLHPDAPSSTSPSPTSPSPTSPAAAPTAWHTAPPATASATASTLPPTAPPIPPPTDLLFGGLPDDPELARQLLEKLNDYLRDSLEHSKPEVALLGATNGLLLQMVFQLHEAIARILTGTDDPFEHLDVIGQGIDAVLRVCRQVDRFEHLRLLLADTRQAIRPRGAEQG